MDNSDAVKEINDKVDHSDKCPNEDDDWGCCCKCVYQVKLHVCGCGKCPATIDGYVCTGVSFSDSLNLNEDKQITGSYMNRKHGQCEIFTERKDYELTLTERKDNESNKNSSA